MQFPAFSHEKAKKGTDEWLTPPYILEELGPFDLDPCAPIQRPWPMAERHYTILDNGLAKPWRGRVWLNPPYADASGWLARMYEHRDGIALVYARTETEAFAKWVWPAASAMLFIFGRLQFHAVDGHLAKSRAVAPSVLIAYGDYNAERLWSSNIWGAYAEGPFHIIGASDAARQLEFPQIEEM